MPKKFNRFVDTLAKNRLQPRRMGRLNSFDLPATLAEAYAVQMDLHQRLTATGFGRRVGFKVGCTTPVMQSFMNIDHPCAGGIMENCMHHESAEFHFSDFSAPGVECEIAVRLGHDLIATNAPFDRESVAPAVATVMPAIEIVDDRYDDFRRFNLETLVSDDFFQAGCILGPEVSDWKSFNLAEIGGRMTVNGRPIGEGVGADILGHPFEALAWLANLRAQSTQHIETGEVILLGSIVQTHWLSSGDRVEIDIEELGAVSAEFLAMPTPAD